VQELVGICQSWQEHIHNKTNAAAMQEECSPKAQADAHTGRLCCNTRHLSLRLWTEESLVGGELKSGE
jgi:hypothetical protein